MWSSNRRWPVQSPEVRLVTSLKWVTLRVDVWVWKEQEKQNQLVAEQIVTVSQGSGLWSWFGIGNQGTL